MTNAIQQKKRRLRKRKRKKCTWCKRRALKKSVLCKRCKRKHRDAHRKSWLRNKQPGAKQYKCTNCGEYGHNARSHKGED